MIGAFAAERLFSLDRVGFRYSPTSDPILRDVSIEIDSGESTAIMGLSGNGKSTLLRIMAGLEAATSGSVRFRGELLTEPRREIGIVFQNYDDTVFPWLSVFENAMLGAPFRENPDALVKADRILEKLGFSAEKRSASASDLSGGQRQRVAIARSLMQDASVVLLDEPFASLDTLMRQQLIALLHELTTEFRTTFVIVSHDIEETLYATRKVYCLLSSEKSPQLRLMDWSQNPVEQDPESEELYVLVRQRAEKIIELLEHDRSSGAHRQIK